MLHIDKIINTVTEDLPPDQVAILDKLIRNLVTHELQGLRYNGRKLIAAIDRINRFCIPLTVQVAKGLFGKRCIQPQEMTVYNQYGGFGYEYAGQCTHNLTQPNDMVTALGIDFEAEVLSALSESMVMEIKNLKRKVVRPYVLVAPNGTIIDPNTKEMVQKFNLIHAD